MESPAGVVRMTLMLAALMSGTAGEQLVDDFPVLSRQSRAVLFTDSSTMGLYIAMVIPVDLPDKNIVVGIKFEANYQLPSNATELSQYGFARQQGRSLRDFTRNVTYHMLRDKFDRYGYDGEQCLLKTICEAAATPLKGTGMLGDIAHVVFTPSASLDEDLGEEYQLAEERGKGGEDCEHIYEECPVSVMTFISATED